MTGNPITAAFDLRTYEKCILNSLISMRRAYLIQAIYDPYIRSYFIVDKEVYGIARLYQVADRRSKRTDRWRLAFWHDMGNDDTGSSIGRTRFFDVRTMPFIFEHEYFQEHVAKTICSLTNLDKLWYHEVPLNNQLGQNLGASCKYMSIPPFFTATLDEHIIRAHFLSETDALVGANLFQCDG